MPSSNEERLLRSWVANASAWQDAVRLRRRGQPASIVFIARLKGADPEYAENGYRSAQTAADR